MLITGLSGKLSKENIHLDTKVNSITKMDDSLIVETVDSKSYWAEKVVICMPPALAVSTITFTPALPNNLASLLPTVQTWMAGAVKFTLEYAEPFWRNQGFSGMLYSHAGIVVEMYDHTNFEGTRFGFTGFLNSGVAGYTREVRKEFVLKQLGELLGEQASHPLAYYDKVWTDEYIVSENQNVQRPHQNNGHPALQNSYMDGRLYFANTETATEFPGYMEGAVISARSAAERL